MALMSREEHLFQRCESRKAPSLYTTSAPEKSISCGTLSTNEFLTIGTNFVNIPSLNKCFTYRATVPECAICVEF